MRNKLRVFLLVLVGIFMLAASASALGDGPTYQLIVPPTNGTGCSGFPHETIDGTVVGCTPDLAGHANFGFFSVAADGSVVFQADDELGSGIWLVHPDGSYVELDDSSLDSSPTISYDGSKVVFARYDLADSNPQADPAVNVSDIYSINSDGSDLQLIASGQGTQYLRLPSISPDGSTVAYWCGPGVNGDLTSQGCGPLTDGSYRNSGVMRVNIDGSNQRMIVIGPGDNLEPVGPTGFSWSPDSQWLAMDGLQTVDLGNDESTAQRQLFEYRTDGSDLFNNEDPTRQITNFVYDPNAVFPNSPAFPRFSPDGSQLLYMDFIDDNGNEGNFSYLVGVDGSDPHQVFLNDGGYEYGAFIPTATPTAPPTLVDETHEPVPSVAAQTVQGATSTLNAAHLTVGTVQHVSSLKVAAGLVVSQNPTAGAIAHRTTKAGPPVALVVSTGPVPGTLAVTKTGTGSGTVTSTPSGIACGSTCTHTFAKGTSVTLAATAASGSVFAGWSGACTGTGKCHLVMSQARTVSAAFKACVVPNVKGKLLASAEAALKLASCGVGTVSKAYSSTVKAGSVISESPAAGTKHAPGTKVALVVSKGPAG